jgi:hypothetical protein
MHFRQIILIEAKNKKDAISETESFYEDNYEGIGADHYSLVATDSELRRDPIIKGGVQPLGKVLEEVREYKEGDVEDIRLHFEQVRTWAQKRDKTLRELGVVPPKEAFEFVAGVREIDSTQQQIGYHLKMAGSLMAQNFTKDTWVYNATEYSCEIPDDAKGWYAVEADIHY